MAKAREIAKRRKAVRNTKKVTKTMEMIATAKFRKAMNRLSISRAYGDALETMAGVLFPKGQAPIPLIEERLPCRHVTLWAVTGNRGLCGGYNSAALRMMSQRRQALRSEGHEVALWISGKKGMAYAKFNHLPLSHSLNSPEDKAGWEEIADWAARLKSDYLSGRTDRVEVIYNRFAGTMSQKPVIACLLPVPAPEVVSQGGGYFWEPAEEKMREEILIRRLEHQLYRILLEAGAVEQMARRVAMKNATDSAEEMIKILTRSYNRARQYQITQEISELVGGAEALKR